MSSYPNPSTAMAASIVDELVRGGVNFFVISPGSRSTALALAAASHSEAETRVMPDERSASFCALGRAKATAGPACVISTSGTAAANFLPAVVEASMSLTPLVVMTADRPIELRGVGANQTIDQVGLYGDYVRYSGDMPAPAADVDSVGRWRSVSAMAVASSRGASGSPGPVHLNVAFHEPTVPVSDDGRSTSVAYPFSIDGRDDGAVWQGRDSGPPPTFRLEMHHRSRGLVIAGDGTYDRTAIAAVTQHLGWPLLATALSGLRGHSVVSTYEHMLAAPLPERFQPDVVVAIGSIGPSKRLESLAASAKQQIRIDRWGRHIDPSLNASAVVHADPVDTLEALVGEVRAPEGWEETWFERGSHIGDLLTSLLAEDATLSGPAVAHALNQIAWESLVVGSSLPIRDVDAYLTTPGAVVANRGASGIDGFVSTASGVASTSRATLALAGDLSVLHDSNGFISDVREPLVMIVVDNNGGGLFDLLPQAHHAPEFERLFIADPHRDLEKLADFHGISYREANSIDDLVGVTGQFLLSEDQAMIRVPVDRSNDLRVRKTIEVAAASVLSDR
ncbi:MAG: 2-succinyl-5-enolpyruvyl-6-hydroxy-3-cyclohexene-1-carboxylic-acid synthase [Acidimicrobiia bacterium]